MEEKRLKVILNKNGSGRITPRVPIPLEWFRKMGLNNEELEVQVQFNEQTGELIYKKITK